VVRRYGWAHSLRFSNDWQSRLWETPKDRPFIIHAAEGTDEGSRREIAALKEAGAFRRRTILVHGVGIGYADLPMLGCSASLVWCLTSNCFTLGRSLDPAVLKSEVAIALGTDSAITGDGDLLDELRFARNAAEPRRLYDMVTSQPARMFDLPAGFGTIADGGPADFLVMKDNGHTPAVTLLESNPELVAVRGRVHLITEELAKACRTDLLALQLQQIDVEGRGKYWIAAPVSEMLRQTKQALPGLTRLAGKAIAA
jgi:hypothetical protein